MTFLLVTFVCICTFNAVSLLLLVAWHYNRFKQATGNEHDEKIYVCERAWGNFRTFTWKNGNFFSIFFVYFICLTLDSKIINIAAHNVLWFFLFDREILGDDSSGHPPPQILGRGVYSPTPPHTPRIDTHAEYTHDYSLQRVNSFCNFFLK